MAAAIEKTRQDIVIERLARERRRHNFGVRTSTAVLFIIVFIVFSGWNIEFAGFRLRTIDLDWGFIAERWQFIAGGVGLTIILSILSIALAIFMAFLGAIGRLSKFPPAYALATFYISLIRGTPLLLQIIFIFLALPQLGIILTGFTAGVLALGINYGAYMTEIFRAGIQSVSHGQREAGIAIGMTGTQIMRRIILPQALRFAIPPIGNQFIAMLKDTALISVTGFVHETLWRAQKVGRANFRSLEALLIAAIFYWVITILFTIVQNRIETYLARGDRGQ